MDTEHFDRASVPPEHVTLWRLIEICHSFVYFADERLRHYPPLGLKGGWMAYFATRSAALGVAPPELVTACFYNFKHTMVARALPDAWAYTTPEAAYRARLRVADDALTRLTGDLLDTPAAEEAAEIAVRAATSTELAGRPLAAAHRGLPLPETTRLRLFWACSVLREYRGDAHNLALVSADVDGCQAHVLMQALGLVPGEQREYRGWSPDDWRTATGSLQQRRWVDDDGTVTKLGRQARGGIERRTDEMCRRPWDALDPEAARRLVALLTQVASRIVTQGGLPYPNAIGAPPAPELAATE